MCPVPCKLCVYDLLFVPCPPFCFGSWGVWCLGGWGFGGGGGRGVGVESHWSPTGAARSPLLVFPCFPRQDLNPSAGGRGHSPPPSPARSTLPLSCLHVVFRCAARGGRARLAPAASSGRLPKCGGAAAIPFRPSPAPSDPPAFMFACCFQVCSSRRARAWHLRPAGQLGSRRLSSQVGGPGGVWVAPAAGRLWDGPAA